MPQIPGISSISAISSAVTSYPDLSRPGAEGMVEGAAMHTCKGSPMALSVKARRPSIPQTLVISWGSAQTVVVPKGSTVSAKWAGVIMLLSMCMWESIKPGRAYRCFPSTVSLAWLSFGCFAMETRVSPITAISPS